MGSTHLPACTPLIQQRGATSHPRIMRHRYMERRRRRDAGRPTAGQCRQRANRLSDTMAISGNRSALRHAITTRSIGEPAADIGRLRNGPQSVSLLCMQDRRTSSTSEATFRCYILHCCNARSFIRSFIHTSRCRGRPAPPYRNHLDAGE